MSKRTLTTLLAAAAVVVVAAFGLFTYQSVAAQSDTPTQAPADPQLVPPGDDGFRGKGMRGIRGEGQEYLAEALGITVEELQAAEQEAQEKAIEQAVAQGLITQAQADRIQDAPFGGRALGRFLIGDDASIDMEALLAEALGISVDALEDAKAAALEAGLSQAVEDGRITQEQADLMQARRALASDETFQTSLENAYNTAIQQAVTNGVITQAQADLLLQAREDRGGRGMFDGPIGFGGRGGRH